MASAIVVVGAAVLVLTTGATSHLTTATDSLSARGGKVTLVASAPDGSTCRLVATPAIAALPGPWPCSSLNTRRTIVVPPNDTLSVRRYTFTLSPGGARANVTVAAAHPVAPYITRQPVNAFASVALTPGTTVARFTARASGLPRPRVQWFTRQPSFASWYPVTLADATSDTLNVTYPYPALYKAVFTNSAGSVSSTPVALVPDHLDAAWSGYEDVASPGSRFTAVSGSWKVPIPSCTTGLTTEYQWVGIDEYKTVEQVGTSTGCVGATAGLYAWYEFWGNPAVNKGWAVVLAANSYPVGAGDVMTGSVHYASGEWEMDISDTTRGWSFSKQLSDSSPPSARSTAEWIVEKPTTPGVTRLTTTTPVSFTDASASLDGTPGPITRWYPSIVTEKASGRAVTSVGRLNSSGSSFTIVYTGP